MTPLRSLFTIFSLLLLAVSTTAKHSPSTHCNVYDLLEDCKDNVIQLAGGEEKNLGELDEFLIEECSEMSGLLVAKCLMKYMCINHGEKAVDSVRDCVQEVCPLARRLPPKLCHA